MELSEQEIIRRQSMEELRRIGIEPYPAAEYVTNAFSTEIKEKWVDPVFPEGLRTRRRLPSWSASAGR